MSRATTILALLTAGALAGCGSSQGGAGSQPVLKAPAPGGDDLLGAGTRAIQPARVRTPAADGRATDATATPAGSPGKTATARTQRAPVPGLPSGARPAGRLTPAGARDIDAVRATLSDYTARLRRGDPSVCADLVTQQFLNAVTGKSGAAAMDHCRRAGAAPTPIELKDVEGVRVQGATAWIQFVAAIRGERSRHVLRLVRADRWRIDGYA
ncbi:MAG: hypothetical protein QOJ97_1355 [Solirubrobacteraceae bacterium]|nr:hypothetical protein [Solirubrobacteraceae bacterium]